MKSISFDDLELYYSSGPGYARNKAVDKTPHKHAISSQGTSNIDNRICINLTFLVYSVSYGRVEFKKDFYFDSYLDLYKTLVKYEVLDAISAPTVNTFITKFKDVLKPDEENHLEISFRIPLTVYKKHTIMDLNNETSDETLLPRGV